MREIIDRNSQRENLKWSRLPVFTEAERTLIKGDYTFKLLFDHKKKTLRFDIYVYACVLGSSDYFGLNIYTGRYVETASENTTWPHEPSFFSDCNVVFSQDDNWPVSASWWLKYVPDSMREILKYIIAIDFTPSPFSL